MEKIQEYTIKVDEISVNVSIIGGKGLTNIYTVEVPQIAPATKALLENIKHGLIREVVVSTTEILDPKSINLMKKKFSERAEQLIKSKIPHIAQETVNLLVNVLMQDMLGLGDIEYLTADENLEEVVITSSGEPVRVYHKRFGWLETNITLSSEEQILNYANIIGRRVGRQITTLNPLLDAHLLTGDRANAVLFPVSTKGHTITIRKFARDPWTMTDLILNKTCNAKILALIWLAMQYEMNILISGGTASGKCVSGDTEVYLENQKIKIKDLVDNIFAREDAIKIDDGFVAPVNIPILSLNPKTLHVEKKYATKAWKRTAPPYLYCLRTASGRSVTVTPEHPFLVAYAGGTFKRADEIEITDEIAVPRTIPLTPHKKAFDFSAMPGKKEIRNDGFIYLSGKGSTTPLRLPLSPTAELMRFIGYIIGDGYITKNKRTVRFFNTDPELLKDIQQLCKNLFLLEGRVCQYGHKTPCIEYPSYLLAHFLTDVINIPAGNKSHIVRVKEDLLYLEESEVKELIRGLFDSEAGITCKKGELEFSSASKGLVEDISFLLTRCGILHHMSTHNSRNRLYIAGKNLSLFSDHIGFISKIKRKDLKIAITKDHSPNFDFVPGIGSLLRDILKSMRLRQSQVKGDLSREAISSYVTEKRSPQRESLRSVSNALREKYDALRSCKEIFHIYRNHKKLFNIIDRIRQVTRLETKELALLSGVDVTTINLWRNSDIIPSHRIWKAAQIVLNDYHSLCSASNPSHHDLRIQGKEIAEPIGITPFAIYPYLRGEKTSLAKTNLIAGAITSLTYQQQQKLQEIKSTVVELQGLLKKSSGHSISEVMALLQTQHRLKNASSHRLELFLEHATTSDIDKKIQRLKHLAESDVLWDAVVSIEKIPSKDPWVYDLTVDDNHTFVANNIVVHNTSFLNVLMPFIPPNHRIVSIEDTRELQLPRFLYWCPLTVRQPNPEGKGAVSMLDLLVNSLRMRPDRIILGEMRKKDQAEVLFEAMHTGHSVYATVHADSIAETIQRLINPPIEVPKNLLVGVNLNVVMFRDRRRGIRRVYQMGEFIPSAEEDGTGVRPNILYRWKPTEDEIVEHSSSLRLFEELSRHTGMTLMQIEDDLKKKQSILTWMVKNNIRHVDKVGEIMRQYYIDPDSVLEMSGERAG